MGEVKVFRVTGKFMKPNLKRSFQKEVRAIKPENAIEKIYKEFGSKHRAKRFQIKIIKVEEISLDENDQIKIIKVEEISLDENEKASITKGER